MPPRPSRLERITNLVLALLATTRPLALREIGALVDGYPAEPGALRQAFERDKRTLRDRGVPLSVERIDGDDQVGYRILAEEYYLPELDLTVDEERALALALTAVRIDGAVSEAVLAKLGGSHGAVPPLVVLPALRPLGPIHAAIRARALLSFVYNEKPRLVAGYGLLFSAGSWYLVGEDRSVEAEDKLRTFRVDRIFGEIELQGSQTYEVPADFDPRSAIRLNPFSSGEAEEARNVEVVLRVDLRDAQALVAAVGQESRVFQEQGGSLVVAFSIADEAAFVSFVLGFGASVEVLEPDRLRRAVVGALDAALASSGVS